MKSFFYQPLIKYKIYRLIRNQTAYLKYYINNNTIATYTQNCLFRISKSTMHRVRKSDTLIAYSIINQTLETLLNATQRKRSIFELPTSNLSSSRNTSLSPLRPVCSAIIYAGELSISLRGTFNCWKSSLHYKPTKSVTSLLLWDKAM